MWEGEQMPTEAEAGKVLWEAGVAHSEVETRQKTKEGTKDHSCWEGLPWVSGH